MHVFLAALASLLAAGALLPAAGAGGGDRPGAGPAAGPVAAAPAFAPLELAIAHVNDHHSRLEPSTAELVLDGEATQVELGGFARLTAAFARLESERNLLKLHAGDALTGSPYYTFYRGAADARMMNTICFDAFVPGNHEFDDGEAALRSFLDALGEGGCRTAVVAANVKPQVGTPLAPAAAGDYIRPHVVKTIDGVRVAIVGITTRGKILGSSRPPATTVIEDEIASAQSAIDALRADGIRHFVLLTHQGYANDRAMAAALTDVDVIIGGDSHTLLGAFGAYGLSPSGDYPTIARNRDGDAVCIGQAWEYGKAIGLMHVRFDAAGRVASCAGRAALLAGDDFRRRDASGAWVALAGAERRALRDRLAADPAFELVAPDATAAALLQGYAGRIAAEQATRLGTATEALCLVRVPGETTNRSGGVAGCEAAHTLARGSDAAQAVAEALLAASPRADFALQNAGGVRLPVPAGEITMGAALALLPFTNLLVELELTGREMIDALEDAVAHHLDAGQSDGSHPYAAGLRWDLDMSRPKGSRFRGVEVRDRAGGRWTAIDPARTYVLATSDFLADGRDGYRTLGKVRASGRRVETGLPYSRSFADWVRARGTVVRPRPGDYSHRSVVTRTGVALPR